MVGYELQVVLPMVLTLNQRKRIVKRIYFDHGQDTAHAKEVGRQWKKHVKRIRNMAPAMQLVRVNRYNSDK